MIWHEKKTKNNPSYYTGEIKGYILGIHTYGYSTPAIGWWFIAKSQVVYNSLLHGKLYNSIELAMEAAENYAITGGGQ